MTADFQQPAFLIIGASRSGTTTLHRCLRDQPSLFLPRKKELNYFLIDREYEQGWDFYTSHFAAARSGQLWGEASPGYLHKGIGQREYSVHRFDEQDDSACRIRQHLPGAKLIVTLRNPIERLYSMYQYNVFKGREPLSLEDALAEELAGRRDPASTPLCYFYVNRYAMHLRHWFQLFAKEQFKVVIFEEWIDDQPAAVRSICEFLGVEYVPHAQGSHNLNPGRVVRSRIVRFAKKVQLGFQMIFRVHSGVQTEYPPLDDEMRGRIWGHLEEDVDDLSRLLERDLSLWSPERTLQNSREPIPGDDRALSKEQETT